MKKLITLCLALAVIAPFTGARAEGITPPFKVIDAQALVNMQKEHKELVVVDARKASADNQMIKGSVSLPVRDMTAESLAEHVATKDTPVVFYCQNPNCSASELAAYKANAAGYTAVYAYEDGIEDWVKRGLAIN